MEFRYFRLVRMTGRASQTVVAGRPGVSGCDGGGIVG